MCPMKGSSHVIKGIGVQTMLWGNCSREHFQDLNWLSTFEKGKTLLAQALQVEMSREYLLRRHYGIMWTVHGL
jgi:hypothetical protein